MRIIVDSHIPNIQGLIEPRAEVLYLEPGDITREAVQDADALIVRTRTRCNADLLDGSRVRFIGSATIGTDHIDLDYCASHGITVRNAPGCNAPAVAQWVFCAIHAWMQQHSITSTDGLTLGIVGVGHIGSIVARWATQLGFTVLLNDPPREMAEETGLTAEKLDLIGITRKPETRSVIYAYLGEVACGKEAVRLQEGETAGFRWMEPLPFLQLIREEPVLQIQYPRYKPYLDRLNGTERNG